MRNSRSILLFVLTLCLIACGRDAKQVSERDTSQVVQETEDASVETDSLPGSPSKESKDNADVPSNWKTYVDEQNGFSFSYPANLDLRIGFQQSHHLTKNWRAMATADQPGTALVSVPVIRIVSKDHYPRYFDVDFRVGISKEGSNSCTVSNGERSIGKLTINGVSFDQYEFSDAAMMQYVSGISYRTSRNGYCFAIEQVRSGSNYRDEASSRDLPQTTLDSSYYLAGKIVKTFRFTK